MPSQSVQKYSCERCKKVWYEDEEVPVAKLDVRMQLSDGETLSEKYDVLCKGCEKTVLNYVKSLIKNMLKSSPEGRKSKAKEKGAGTPSSNSAPTVAAGISSVAPPVTVAAHPRLVDGSARQSR